MSGDGSSEFEGDATTFASGDTKLRPITPDLSDAEVDERFKDIAKPDPEKPNSTSNEFGPFRQGSMVERSFKILAAIRPNLGIEFRKNDHADTDMGFGIKQHREGDEEIIAYANPEDPAKKDEVVGKINNFFDRIQPILQLTEAPSANASAYLEIAKQLEARGDLPPGAAEGLVARQCDMRINQVQDIESNGDAISERLQSKIVEDEALLKDFANKGIVPYSENDIDALLDFLVQRYLKKPALVAAEQG